MIERHVEVALRCPSFGMELLDIAAHVYMDTFSQYGFRCRKMGSLLN